MRTIEEVREVLELVELGLNDCEISRRTGIPKGTIRDWRRGKIPRCERDGDRIVPSDCCANCGHPQHEFEQVPVHEYAYLLGLYLGDGCISAHRRGVFRLRITLDSRYPGIISECAEAMAAVLPSSKVGVLPHRKQNSVEVSSFSRAWPGLACSHSMEPARSMIERSGWSNGSVESWNEIPRGCSVVSSTQTDVTRSTRSDTRRRRTSTPGTYSPIDRMTSGGYLDR